MVKFSYFVCGQSDVVANGDAVVIDIPSGDEIISVALTRHAARCLQEGLRRALDETQRSNVFNFEKESDHG